MMETGESERMQSEKRHARMDVSPISVTELEEMGAERGRDGIESVGTKKRRRKGEGHGRKGGGGYCEDRDPLVVFGEDIFSKILSHLDALSVARSLLVSCGWHKVASSDRLWTSKLEELWSGKAHLPCSSMVRGISKLAAYSFSIMDGKRSRIMKEDLCDHVWELRFKEHDPWLGAGGSSIPKSSGTAPEYWRNLDPSWKGTGPPMHRYFHPNGSQTADQDDQVWGGHECTYSTVTSFVDDGRIREHYVRINRWPKMSVMRKPDWSWEMANQLCCYSSVFDAYKCGGTGPLFPVW